MKKFIKYSLLILWAHLALITSYGQDLPKGITYRDVIPDIPNPPRLCNDLADILSPSEEDLLEQKLLDFEKTSSNELAIVTVESLGGLAAWEFANELGRKWSIGKQKKKNGVLILVAKTDREVNISPGYGLSGKLTSAVCGKIIRSHITPNFKAGNFYQGLSDASDAVIAATNGLYTSEDETHNMSPVPKYISVFLLLFLFAFIIFLFIMLRKNRRNIYVSRRGYTYDRGWDSLPGTGGGWFSGSDWGSGGGGGGGFGGFGGGGGGFDGGGASGSW